MLKLILSPPPLHKNFKNSIDTIVNIVSKFFPHILCFEPPGKTQVCLHSTASIVLQGKPVVYLQTEGGGFPINRLEQMIQQREKM